MITGPRPSMKLARKLRSEMSLPEVLLWDQLRHQPEGLKFRRQHPAGEYVLDFSCARARLAIEVDGRAHDSADAALRDANRSAFLRSRGIATTRIPAVAVLEDVGAVVIRIVEICRARSEIPMVPLHQPSAGPPPRSGEES